MVHGENPEHIYFSGYRKAIITWIRLVVEQGYYDACTDTICKKSYGLDYLLSSNL